MNNVIPGNAGSNPVSALSFHCVNAVNALHVRIHSVNIQHSVRSTLSSVDYIFTLLSQYSHHCKALI